MKGKAKKLFAACALLLLMLALCLGGCGSQSDTAQSEAEQSGSVQSESAQSESAVADGLAKIKVEGETDLPGNFFLSFVYSRNLIMLDGKGNIVWSKHEEQPKDGVNTGWWDFKKHDVDGTTYYSYHDQNYQFDNYGLLGYAPGERVILDEDFNEVKRITMEKSDVTEKGQGADGHDFLMIDPDHYILSCYVKENVKNVPDYPDGTNIIYSYLQEVKDGEVVWDWKSKDYPELYDIIATEATPTANDFANEQVDAPDTVHFNAMRLDDEGNLICSFRHLDTILCLDRTKQKDQIKWKLSGKADEFGLTELQKTSGQHYVTVDGNQIMVFDNNNRDEQTEIRTYTVDFANKKVDPVKAFSFSNKFSQACGSVQRVNGGQAAGDQSDGDQSAGSAGEQSAGDQSAGSAGDQSDGDQSAGSAGDQSDGDQSARDLYVIGWGWATTDAECMSVYDFSTGEELMNVTLGDPQNITYRCVYYE